MFDSNKFEITLLQPVHIESIVDIGILCDLATWSISDYQNEIERIDSFGLVCIEKKEKKVIGFIFMRLIMSVIINPLIDTDKLFNESEILNIAVHPNFQRKGVAQELFETFIMFCRRKEIKEIWLEVRASNLKARTFYEKNGFKEMYRRKNYYTNPPEDAVIMCFEL
jgi:ribosomal-protein-alanine N-acetyltransferase